uniref:Uncharacterized protein n=1 Tax=Lepeophtheirus salmonis TaxID=72036 RepID=A0A0K2TTL6_LEPSM
MEELNKTPRDVVKKLHQRQTLTVLYLGKDRNLLYKFRFITTKGCVIGACAPPESMRTHGYE